MIGLDCPTKLYYTGKDEYADQRLGDPFLQELANGGFQVGALAKKYFPGGIEISTKDNEKALAETNVLLEQEDVIIFEAAFFYKNLFIRVDALRKKGDRIDVIEVKSKSFDSTDEGAFIRKRDGFIFAKWMPYFYDVAFQKHVVSKAFPDFSVYASLMMADKSKKCPTDGLNQKFRVKKNQNDFRFTEVIGDLTADDVSTKILKEINVDRYCEMIFSNAHTQNPDPLGFVKTIEFLAGNYERDKKIEPKLGGKCGKCQFRASNEDKENGKKSGYEECWKNQLGWDDPDFAEPTVLEISYFSKKNKLLNEKRAKMSQVREEDVNPKPDSKTGISTSQRQWLQVAKVQHGDTSAYIDKVELKREFEKWKFPLHFIDFETSMAAIPFLKGQRPYEPIAFQFSHHVVGEDGSVEHKTEFLSAEPGDFPNYQFVRALKTALENDKGTIFRYASHENTYLNHILKQLVNDTSEIEDREKLVAFIKTITKSSGSSAEKWIGERNMVDLFELVKRYFYDPYTRGSNSIKKVLPAIMRSSEYLKEKYSKPIYGAEIKSLNFGDEPKAWVNFEGDELKDPYSLLPRMFEGVDKRDYEILSESDELGDGGAALAAYAKLQYEDMSEMERGEIKKALLRYCELDTMAMVMIYEGWREMIR
jgi:hypothetical protein